MPSQNQSVQLSYQVCPIILTGGVASNIPGGTLPILSLFMAVDFSGDLDDSFASFNVLPGGQLVLQEIAKYPFANQYVAANAVIRQPLTLSVIMDTPMRGPKAWANKQSIFTALKGILENHNNTGGTYTVMTPAYMYDNMVMISMTDNSRSNNSLPQNAWRFDFERPLVAMQELTSSLNVFNNNINSQVPTDTSQTGVQTGLQGGNIVGGEAIAQLPGSSATTDQITSTAGNLTVTTPSSSDVSTPEFSGSAISGIS